MRSSLTPPSGAGRFGPRLLLALALCACGGGDGADDAPEARQAGAAAASASQAAGPAPCPAPPTANPELFRGHWATFSRHIAEIGARFAEPSDSSTATVRFCQNCRSAEVQIISEATTYCTTPEQMDSGGSRILAVLVLKSDYPGDTAHGWRPIPANDSIFMFADSSDGPATLVYRHRGKDGDSTVVAPASSWTFYYCRDRHPRTARAQAKWRSRGKPGPGNDDGGGAYAWMACASGCCQFYTPPPNETETRRTTPRRANPNAPDAVGNGQGWGRPPWCPADRAGTP